VPADLDSASRAAARSSAARNDAVVNLSKRRGFVFPSSEIYGGTRSAWDYGPLGVELKENVRRQWWKAMVTGREDIVGIDSAVILASQVWEASGHVATFSDPLTECTNCHRRYRADHLEEEFEARKGRAPKDGLAEVACPNCGTRGQWTEPKQFSGMLRTFLGPTEDESALHYLRPETAQGIFVNFLNVMTTASKKPPFGIAQTGKSFRNEITPGNFIFRTREFEQMEMEFFVEPGTDEQWHEYWLQQRWNWYVGLGINPENLRYFEHPKEKLSHYSKRTVDIEYRFGFGGTDFAELEGIANRTDFDLSTHTKHSGTDLSYFDQEKNERWTPYVIEPAAGLTRAVLAFLLDAYVEDEAPNAKGVLEKRTVLRLDHRLAPVKAAVLPLSRNADLSPVARELAATLRKHWNVEFDDAQAIGRRYRRQDEIGTPFCITVDFDSLQDHAVTVRERDSMEQQRVALDQVEQYLAGRLLGA
jgi:glycyl-tRNA synthetase